MTERDARLIWELQQGLPLAPEPFRLAGERLGFSAADVLERIRSGMESGQIRRLGGVFDSRRLGYRSLLCAAKFSEKELAEKAEAICSHPGVTHGYERGWPSELDPGLPGGPSGRRWPNFWFTLAAPQADFDREREALRKLTAPHNLLELPALRRFKIDVTFDPRTRDRDEHIAKPRRSADLTDGPDTQTFSPSDQAVVRALEGNLPLTERPFEQVAAKLDMTQDDLLQKLVFWTEQGVLRRVAAIVSHRKLGFTANGMCIWDVPESDVAEAGRRVAAAPEVTHCYQRLRIDRFPFTLYAMIHTGDWETTRRLFERIGGDAGLKPGQLLLSMREFKKTSMSYFV